MNLDKLPARLKREPLVDAVFEVRFDSSAPASAVLPGVLFGALSSEGINAAVEAMPAAQMPAAVRSMDPAMVYAPLVRLAIPGFYYLVSDRSYLVSCRLPYPGWASFRKEIVRATTAVQGAGIIRNVERVALKYVDVVDEPTIREQLASFDIAIQVGASKLSDNNVNMQLELRSNSMVHSLHLITSANVTFQDTGAVRTGALFQVETSHSAVVEGQKLSKHIEGIVDSIHAENKKTFFSCLSETALKKLEPIYD